MKTKTTPIPLSETADESALPKEDPRPRMPEPLPVKLLTVDDARLIAGNGLEVELDAFYVTLLAFEREALEDSIVYRAENFRLIFSLVEPPVVREDMRSLGIEVLSLRQVEQKLIDGGIEYAWQKSLTPGRDSLLLQDPGGNWIELVEASMVR